MANPLSPLKKIDKFLKHFPYLVALPSGFSFIGVEEIIEIHFSCPCAVGVNSLLTWSIFTGPPLLIFTLLFYYLRPFKHTDTNDNKQNSLKAFISCLFPPVIWVIIFFLDGDYFACYKMDWKGVYVFDMQLNRSWCKPTEVMTNETELRYLINNYVFQSQCIGFFTLASFSIIIFLMVCIYDCCKCGKRETQREGQGRRQDQVRGEGEESMELHSNT